MQHTMNHEKTNEFNHLSYLYNVINKYLNYLLLFSPFGILLFFFHQLRKCQNSAAIIYHIKIF